MLWVGESVSQFAEQAGSVVLPLCAVLSLHVDAGQLGLLRAVYAVPVLLFSLFAGAWVDRRSSRTVMMLADGCRALVLGGLAFVSLLGELDLPTLLGVAFTVGTLAVFFDVGYQACVVRLLDRELLAQGTSALEGSRSAAQTMGPAIGGALVSLFRATAGAGLCAALFAVSFVSIRRMHRPEAISSQSEHSPRFGQQIHEGLRFVLANPLLRTLALVSAAFQFSFSALMTVYLLFLPRDLHASGTTIGLALAATGPGAALGSLLAARLPKRFGYGVVLVLAPAIGDGVLLCLPALHGPGTATVAALLAVNFVFGLCSQVVDIAAVAVRQAVTAHEMQGRASATVSFFGMGLTPFGSLLGGYLAQEWGLRATLLAAVIGTLLSPTLIALSPLARLGRTLPTPDVPEALQEQRVQQTRDGHPVP